MVSLYAVAVSSIAFIALLQPVIAATAIGPAVARLLGGEVGSGNLKMHGTIPLCRNNSSTNLNACMGQSITSNLPTMLVNSSNTVTINGLPATCMAEIKAYNAQSNIAALNAVYSIVTVINSTAVKLLGLTSRFLAYFKGVSKKEN